MEQGSSGPLWLTITIAVLSFLGVVVTAVVGPIVVDRRRERYGLPDSSEPGPGMIARKADEAVSLIQSEITDLQHRVGRLESMRMAGSHGER